MDNKQNSLHLVQEYSQKLSVPRISQFSSSYMLLENCFFSEQIVSVDKCSSTLFFRAKWRLLFYVFIFSVLAWH